MNSSKFNANSSKLSKTLEKLDEVNKAASLQEKIDENQILLIVLSTTVMMVKEKKLDKEYYQWTRSYLQHVRDENGRKLSNIENFIQRLDKAENDFGIEDELKNLKAADVQVNPMIIIDGSQSESFFTGFVNEIVPVSTPKRVASNEPLVDDQANPTPNTDI